MVNVYCLKWGKKYNRSFVEKLKENVKKYLTLNHNFYCYTDQPEKDYDIPTKYNLNHVWHKLALLEFKGNSLFFDLDIEINDNIDFLCDNFNDFTVVNSKPWKNINEDLKFKINNNTFVNSSIMSWSDSSDIFKKFYNNKDTYIRLYKGIDRFIFNENIPHKYFSNDNIMSWKEENFIKKAIVLYNGKYKN